MLFLKQKNRNVPSTTNKVTDSEKEGKRKRKTEEKEEEMTLVHSRRIQAQIFLEFP